AFKFTERGEVELSLSVPQPGWVAFAVRDTGIGIAPDQQEVIFEAFRQADGTTSRKYGGTGLGRSISRALAQRLPGHIDVHSRPGHGSTFTLTLPLDAGSRRDGEAKAPAPAPADARERTDGDRERRRRPPASAEPAPASGPAPAVPDDRDRLQRQGRLILVVEDDVPFARILYDLAHELDFDCAVATTADEGLTLARRLSPS